MGDPWGSQVCFRRKCRVLGARGLGAGCEPRGREEVDAVLGKQPRRVHAGKEKGTLVAGDAGPVTRGLGSLGEDLASFYQEI